MPFGPYDVHYSLARVIEREVGRCRPAGVFDKSSTTRRARIADRRDFVAFRRNAMIGRRKYLSRLRTLAAILQKFESMTGPVVGQMASTCSSVWPPSSSRIGGRPIFLIESLAHVPQAIHNRATIGSSESGEGVRLRLDNATGGPQCESCPSLAPSAGSKFITSASTGEHVACGCGINKMVDRIPASSAPTPFFRGFRHESVGLGQGDLNQLCAPLLIAKYTASTPPIYRPER